jgi:hypothetical protein
MIDMICLVILGVVTWCVASEGAWGAGLILLTVVFSGLLAMNFFEPLAETLDGFGMGSEWSYRWDMIALVGLFAVFVVLFRLIHEKLLPTFLVVQSLPFEIIRWTCGLATGYVTVAFLLAALHTAPLPREYLGFTAERRNFFGLAPDRQWLGFTQYVTERAFFNGNPFDRPAYQLANKDYPYPEQYLSQEQWSDRDTNELRRIPVWPSYPIRYAARRDELASGGPAAVDQGGAAPASGDAPKKNF